MRCLLPSLQQDYFFGRRLQRTNLTNFSGRKVHCCWFLVFIYQPLLVEFQCRIDLRMMVAAFSYLNVTTEDVRIASKAVVADKWSTLCLLVIQNLICFKIYTTCGFVKAIVAITQNVCWRLRRLDAPRCVSELNVVHYTCKDRTGISHRLLRTLLRKELRADWMQRCLVK